MAYSKEDITNVAIGSALLGSGGGGSFTDSLSILNDVPSDYQADVKTVDNFDQNDGHAVVAFLGSPSAGENLTLSDVSQALKNTIEQLTKLTDYPRGIQAYTAGETGATNMVVPLLVPLALGDTQNLFVVDGDGAGRAVPKIDQVTYASTIPISPVVLANNQMGDQAITVDLNVSSPSIAEVVSRGVASSGSLGAFVGIGLYSEASSEKLADAILAGTIGQARELGAYMQQAKRSTSDIASFISNTLKRESTLIVQGTLESISQTTSGGFDVGQVIIKDNNSGDIYTIYNLNENLIMYNNASPSPVVVAPDSICYYSEDTGRSFSNAMDDINPYLNKTISAIKIAAIPKFASQQGIIESFRTTVQSIGYAGKLPLD
ncbi:MAG: DUF917 family protein [Gammaproteobacteria bacterium]|nr:DUF917 family protein [Gammaproteobacteria bacterium]